MVGVGYMGYGEEAYGLEEEHVRLLAQVFEAGSVIREPVARIGSGGVA